MQLVGDRGERTFRRGIVHDSPARWHWHSHLCLYGHVYSCISRDGARWMNPMGLAGFKGVEILPFWENMNDCSLVVAALT